MYLKKISILSVVLRLRKVVLFLLGVVMIASLLIYWIANSPLILKKVADTFASDYNITYHRIYGNIFTGIEIEDLAYHREPLVKHIRLKWNPNALLKKEIKINHLVLDKVNVDTLKKLTNAFSGNDNSDSSEPFAFSVKVVKSDISIDPFVEENIMVRNIMLHTKNIFYDSQSITLESLGLSIDSNLTKVRLNASLEKGSVTIKKMDIDSLDTLAIEKILHSVHADTAPVKQEHSVKSISHPLIPKYLYIEALNADILPRVIHPLKIDVLSLGITDVRINLFSQIVEKAQLSLLGKTNFAMIEHSGKIKENHFIGKIKLEPKKPLFTHYKLPVRMEPFKKIEMGVDATKARIVVTLDTKMKHILKAKKNDFNLDIDVLKSMITYSLDDAQLKAKSNAVISTPYAKGIKVSNQFFMDKNISYRGDIFVKQLEGVEPKWVQPFNNLSITYQGDEKNIDTKIVSDRLQGTLISKDLKHVNLHIKSKNAIFLRDYMTLPLELNASKATVVIDAPLNLDRGASSLLHMKVASNIANIDTKITYQKRLEVNTLIDVPQKSLLRTYHKALKWDRLFPLKAKTTLYNTEVKASADAGVLHLNAVYDLNSTHIDGKMQLGGFKANILGIAQKNLMMHSTISSIPSFLQTLSEVYTLEPLPKVEGHANLDVKIEALKKADISLTSPLIRYHADHQHTTDIRNMDIGLGYKEGNITLEHYALVYAKEKIFSTKVSHISLLKDTVVISPLWVNNQLKVEGSYNLKTKKGKIVTSAKKMHLDHEIIKLNSSMDVTTVLEGNKTNIEGKIVILDGHILYDMSQKSFASDSDIVVVQDMKKKEKSAFMDNLSMELQVKTKKPLLYNKNAVHIKSNVDLGIHKAQNSELLVLGEIELLKGGTYNFQGKKFVLQQSKVYFTGNPNKPLLDIKVNYKSLKYLVTIAITGSADLPNITFSSKPSLTKEQILSLILFDTEGGAGTNSGDDMMKMMGGAMAKSALNDLGVKLDHLVLGEGNSVEVGKKLTNKITIIYVNGIVSKVKLKYEHSPRTESVIGVSEESQSYDIIYKRDF
ncbi:hypothetical protein MNB_SV-3-221 [hydrothermal vent metagenome]|uniref:Translocation and assembly module TamB C-terminal domain-containing protein n=1 Tax=hydrothermal vent metagenome TaxID=652676 RepID=A0A1W1BJD6_9ZZZZ